MTAIPYVAIGADELGEPTETIDCARCGQTHALNNVTIRTKGLNTAWSKPALSNTLRSYWCAGDWYVVTIERLRAQGCCEEGEHLSTITINRATVEQALEALEYRDGDGADQWKADVITALRAALAQQTEPYRLPDESVRSTHSEECWQWHQACAVAAVIRLRAEVARMSKRDGE